MARPVKGVPELKQRNGVYNIFYYEPGADGKAGRTKRIGLRTRDPVEATTRFAAFLTEGRDVFAGTEKGLSTSQALDDYYREHVCAKDDKGRPKVVDRVRQEVCIHHLKGFFKDDPLSSIDIPKCVSYTEARRAGLVGGTPKRPKHKKGSDSTIRRELSALAAAAEHALRWKRITLDKMPTFELPSIEKPIDTDLLWMTKEEVQKLFDSTDGKLRAFCRLAYFWAARRGWVERLQRYQVDFIRNRVDPYKPGEKRTQKRRRIMPIFDEIRPDLELLCKDLPNDGYLFGKHFQVYYAFTRACEALGMADKGNPHILRHSRASHLLMDGEPLWKVAQLLCDTTKTTEKTYAHINEQWLAGGEKSALNAPLA